MNGLTQHHITDSTKDAREMVVTMPSGGIDMLTFEHKHMVSSEGRPTMARTADPVSLDRESAKVLFGVIGAFLHGWEAPGDD